MTATTDQPTSEEPAASSFDDPLAVRVGLFVGSDDLPCDGWPDEFRPDVVDRVLAYIPND